MPASNDLNCDSRSQLSSVPTDEHVAMANYQYGDASAAANGFSAYAANAALTGATFLPCTQHVSVLETSTIAPFVSVIRSLWSSLERHWDSTTYPAACKHASASGSFILIVLMAVF